MNFAWIPSYIDPMRVKGVFSIWVGITDELNFKKYIHLCNLFNELNR